MEENEGMQYAIGIDASILKTKLSGLLKGSKEDTQVLILPTLAEKQSKLTFDELLEAVAEQFKINKEKTTAAIKSITDIFPEFEPDELSFELNQIFFYYQKEKEAESGTIEYAFSIKINLGGLLNLANILTIESLYMAIWNTERESVLKEFKMDDLTNLLPE